MTVKELAGVIGVHGTLLGDRIKPAVVIEGVREVWGRVDYLVRPLVGEGEAWVSAERVRLDEKKR